jgi:hypothetical protein
MNRIFSLARFALFVVASPLLQAAPVTIGNPSTLSLSFAADGRPQSFQAAGKEFLDTRNPGAGFTLQGSDSSRPGPVEFAFKDVSFDGKQLVISLTPNSRVTFAVKATDRYLAFRISRVEGIPRKNLLWLRLQMSLGDGVKALPLDGMTQVRHGAREVSFPWLWKRQDTLPMGGFALYAPTSPEDEDQTLLHLWTSEGLPHPKVAGEWNIQTARKWLADWQRSFSDQSQMLISASSNQELYQLADYAATLDIKRIYMHTDTWRGEYWPKNFSFLHLNPQVFPKGEADFKAFSDYARSKGIGLTIHTVSCSIAPNDPDYVVGKVDPRLAKWIDGTLVDAISATDKVLRFRPNPGQEWPLILDRPITGPSHVDPWNDIRAIRIGNELINVGQFTDTDKDVWTLRDCTRGLYQNGAAAHSPGTEVVGLIRPYGQVFTADNDSSLVDELAERIAGFYNRNNIIHVEQDAGEIHTVNHAWGYARFAEAVYTRLEHPVTSYNSGGSTMPCQLEYRFHSSKAVLAARKQVLVPLMLERNGRQATGPYELFSSVGKEAAAGNSSIGIQKPEPMFGISTDILTNHGLAGLAADTVKSWKQVAPLLSAEQCTAIQKAGDEVIHRAEPADGGFAVTPLRMLSRPGIDIGWHQGSEFGPIVPRQYVRPNESLRVHNPWSQQVPEFVIRVMPALGGKATAVENVNNATSNKDQSRIDDYNTGTGQKSSDQKNVTASTNIAIQPIASAMQETGDHRFSDTDHGLRIEFANPRGEAIDNPEKLPFWKPSGSMEHARGIGLTVTGDGSNAILVIQTECAGPRDYIVPLDFKGPREIVIPCGEVSWSDRRWGWRFSTKNSRYGNLTRVSIGLGKVPPQTHVDVVVSNLRLLPESPVVLRDPVISINNGTLQVSGEVRSDSYLWYRGGDTVGVYDLNWKPLAPLPVVSKNFTAPQGDMDLKISAPDIDPSVWFECQFFVKDSPMIVKNPGK